MAATKRRYSFNNRIPPKFRDREELYRIMWKFCDRHGVLTVTQQELQEPLKMSYQAISEVVSEFIGMGMIEKESKTFRLVYEPDQIPWGAKFDDLRRRYRDSILRSEDGT